MGIIDARHKEKEPALKSLATLSVVFAVLFMTCEFSAGPERLLGKSTFGPSFLTLDVDQLDNISSFDNNADVVPSPFIQLDADVFGWIDHRLVIEASGDHHSFTQIRAPPHA